MDYALLVRIHSNILTNSGCVSTTDETQPLLTFYGYAIAT